jgi:nitrile hydratase
MDGVHDVGGMHGFGRVDPDDEGPFHHEWERATFGTFVATLGQGLYSMDEVRHSIERMAPDRYLTATYFEKWLAGMETLLTEAGVVTPGDLLDRLAAVEAGEATVPDRADPDLLAAVREGMYEAYDVGAERVTPRFAPGDRVRVRNDHPSGHTRSPRYVRGVEGSVVTERGTFSLPDAGAHGREATGPVYSVRFDPADIWGEEAEADDLRVDLWESYLTEVDA